VLVEELFPGWDESGGGSKAQAPFAAPTTSTLKGQPDENEVRPLWLILPDLHLMKSLFLVAFLHFIYCV
jgi:hypothetical protein